MGVSVAQERSNRESSSGDKEMEKGTDTLYVKG